MLDPVAVCVLSEWLGEGAVFIIFFIQLIASSELILDFEFKAKGLFSLFHHLSSLFVIVS